MFGERSSATSSHRLAGNVLLEEETEAVDEERTGGHSAGFCEPEGRGDRVYVVTGGEISCEV